MRDRYSLTVGLLFALVIAIAFIHTINSNDNQTLGIDKLPAHWSLPEFAVPAAAGGLEGDANVAQDDCESAQTPCPSSDRRSPACRIPTRDAIRVCDLFDRPLVLSFWFEHGGNCVRQQDVVSEVSRRYRGRVGFLSLDIRDSRESVRELIRQRGWKMPVGYDRDGAVAELYRVGGCPTFAFAFPGGTLQDATIGELTAPQLEAHVRKLLRAARTASNSHPARREI